MKSIMHHLALLSLVCSLLTLRANAQNASQPAVSVKFTVIGWSDDTPSVYYKQGGKLSQMEVLPFTRSKVHNYNGSARMELYSQQSDKPAGIIDFPVGPKRFTILLGGKNGQFQARVIEDDVSGFPMGTARIFNLLNTRMQFRCNQKDVVTIPAGKHQIARPRPDRQLVLEAAVDRNGQWKRANDDFVYTPQDAQTSVFYFETDAKYFVSADGYSRAVKFLVLQEKPGQEEDKAGKQEAPKHTRNEGDSAPDGS